MSFYTSPLSAKQATLPEQRSTTPKKNHFEWSPLAVDALKENWGIADNKTALVGLFCDLGFPVSHFSVLERKSRELGLPAFVAQNPYTPVPPHIKRAEPFLKKLPQEKKGLTLLDLQDDQCRNPVAQTPEGVLLFCGHKVQPGHSYCPACSERNKQPKALPQKRKPRLPEKRRAQMRRAAMNLSRKKHPPS